MRWRLCSKRDVTGGRYQADITEGDSVRPKERALQDEEYAALCEVARSEAGKRLTWSGHHEIKDVVQQVMADYVTYAADHDVSNPGGLVRIMARRRVHKYRDAWERRRGWATVLVGEDEDETDDHGARAAAVDGLEPEAVDAGPEDAVVDAMVADSERESVAYALSLLKPEFREIAELTYLADPQLKAPAVAEQLGLSPGTVRNRLVEIRRVLAELLEVGDDGNDGE